MLSVETCYEGAGCTGLVARVVQDPAHPDERRRALVRQAADLTNAAREGTSIGRDGR
jgi:hypothetical protein